MAQDNPSPKCTFFDFRLDVIYFSQVGKMYSQTRKALPTLNFIPLCSIAKQNPREETVKLFTSHSPKE